MKYWQKTYFATLLLFLLALNAGTFLLFRTAFSTSLSAERERGFSEHGFIREGLEKDVAAVLERSGDQSDAALNSLFQSYSDYYAGQDISLMLQDAQGGRQGYVPEPLNAPSVPEDGSQSSIIKSVSDIPYLYVSGFVGDTGYALVTARSVAAIRHRADTLAYTLMLGSAGLSALLAAALYLILKKLTHPIKTLAGAAAALAEGDYGVRADVNGRDELAGLARRFNDMAEKIQSQISELTCEAEKKQRFIDDLAHELRTPLAAIRGYAQYLAEADINEDERLTALLYISRESARLADMSEKLLTLTKLNNDPRHTRLGESSPTDGGTCKHRRPIWPGHGTSRCSSILPTQSGRATKRYCTCCL